MAYLDKNTGLFLPGNSAGGNSGGGGGGESGGGSTGYYKCASVDTTAKTWTGYKAVLSDGVYSFEDTVTEGLSYGTVYTPRINGIYNDDAIVKAAGLYTGIPVGHIFHASLSNAQPSSGGALVQQGGSFSIIDGVPCYSASDNKLTFFEFELSAVNGMSYSVWIYPRALSGWQNYISLNSTEYPFNLWSQDGKIGMWYASYSLWSPCLITKTNRWYHCCLVYDSGKVIFSFDGNICETLTSMSFGNFTGGIIGKNEDQVDAAFADLRIYDRPLTIEEINSLAAYMPK